MMNRTKTALSADVQNRLDDTTLSSCPVQHGQLRWTIGCDGSIRQCNYSSVASSNLCSDAAQLPAEEIGFVAEPDRFVQIQVT